MCRVYDNCADCPLDFFCEEAYQEQDSGDHAVRAVRAIEQWAKEHPVKTRQSEFLKMFPETIVLYDEYIDICPAQISSECRDKETGGCYDLGMDCGKCKRDFWLKEIE